MNPGNVPFPIPCPKYKTPAHTGTAQAQTYTRIPYVGSGGEEALSVYTQAEVEGKERRVKKRKEEEEEEEEAVVHTPHTHSVAC